ncbi:long-chain-fatty-acid--CoA ligase [Chengkuizengella sediminis]|uniref:long-chain-fatty-acid--CoA ligase n=1 Tax=Chengkuizengella sediminis TaxID=1885917 RepID=UPI00138A222E|nr:long-chain fatty acid--CoA ligase [Chengkuizengella sediminis]NDI33880.1 long-chain fatty acid--CoA ligase [Chengkuizengella sediminis]
MSKDPWTKNYPEGIEPHLEYPSQLVSDFLKNSTEQFPNHNAIYYFGTKITYSELIKQAYKFANLLKEKGVKPGDRVAIMLPNIPQYIYCYYGVLFMGGIVVQTNPLYVERELEHHLKDSGAKTIVALDLVYSRVKAVKEKVNLDNVFITGIQDHLPLIKKLLYPLVQKFNKGPYTRLNLEKEQVLSLKKELQQASDNPVDSPSKPDEVAVLQYTGGTTGVSKGVMLTHINLVSNTIQCQTWVKVKKGRGSVLAVVPLFHVYGMTTCMNFSVASGAVVNLIPKFEVDSLLKLIESQKPTIFPGAPTLYQGIINHPKVHQTDLSSIECCISGSAPLPVSTQQKFEELTKGKLVEGYGLSEASPVVIANPVWGHRIEGSIGIPWPNTDSKVVNELGEEVPPHEIGEIIVKGPQVMKGYWNQPEETAAVLRDGWLYTGDMGYMDNKGYFYIVDRKKDMIIASGYNVYPREIEEVLYNHPAVKEAIVLGVPDKYRGETVKAYIVRKKDSNVTDEALNQYCRSNLASYKVPRIYEFRDELPKSMVGKILRRVLAEEHAATLEE